MPEYEIDVSATILGEFERKPTEDDIIAWLRKDPHSLLIELQVDYIENEKGEEQKIK